MELEQTVVELKGKKIDLSRIGNERVAQVLSNMDLVGYNKGDSNEHYSCGSHPCRYKDDKYYDYKLS